MAVSQVCAVDLSLRMKTVQKVTTNSAVCTIYIQEVTYEKTI